MPAIGAPGLVALRRSTATPRLNFPRSRILISRSPPPGAVTTFWISSALTTVATSFCENAVDGTSIAVRTAAPINMRCIAIPSSEVILHAELDQPSVENLGRLQPRRGRHLRGRRVGSTKERRRALVEDIVEIDVCLQTLPAEFEDLAAAQVQLPDAWRERRQRREQIKRDRASRRGEITRLTRQLIDQLAGRLRVDLGAGEGAVGLVVGARQILIDAGDLDVPLERVGRVHPEA